MHTITAVRPRAGRPFPAGASLIQPAAIFICALFLLKILIGSSQDARNRTPLGAQFTAGAVGGGQAPSLDVGQPPLLTGLQHKSGPLGVLMQLARAPGNDTRAREALYYPEAWVQQRLRGESVPPVARVASVLISRKYKLLFVKCTKTAGEVADPASCLALRAAVRMLTRHVGNGRRLHVPARHGVGASC